MPRKIEVVRLGFGRGSARTVDGLKNISGSRENPDDNPFGWSHFYFLNDRSPDNSEWTRDESFLAAYSLSLPWSGHFDPHSGTIECSFPVDYGVIYYDDQYPGPFAQN